MAAVQMHAGVIAGPGQFALRNADRPEPGPGQVLLRMEGSGVCASSLPLWEGREWFSYPQPPGAPGHEGWGRVAALGQGVSGLSEGDRVAALTYMQERHAAGEIVTGLLYVDPEPRDLHAALKTCATPLNALGDTALVPGSAALDKLNATLR